MTELFVFSVGFLFACLVFGGGPDATMDSRWGRGTIVGLAFFVIAVAGRGLGF